MPDDEAADGVHDEVVGDEVLANPPRMSCLTDTRLLFIRVLPLAWGTRDPMATDLMAAWIQVAALGLPSQNS